eukprot:CAMPEP_0168309468 /NCGR_PEP_ID=MMETSP0142_2-20121227/66292_1 /TAXON_ID=44445 /ORGANISM="Pseudo-nitzschia australis, Strain 10249 10 AB" /LENGTH=707 /DNA_ID=CAMNT_0008262189 /DNA_START=130 /DNA_END=2250 /DNA_ORIENTATION=-
MNHTSRSNWKIGDWCWGDAASTSSTSSSRTTIRTKLEDSSSPEESSRSPLSATTPWMPDSVSSATNASATVSRLKRESMPRDDDALRVLATSAASSDPTPRLCLKRECEFERDPPMKTEPSSEDRTDRNTKSAPAIAPSSSPVPSNVTSSTSATLSSNENNNDDAVPDPFVSSSSLPDFSGSSSPAHISSSLPSITEATRKFGGEDSGDGKRCRRWKPGDWCWLKEGEDIQEKQREMVAEDIHVEVEQVQETAVSRETTMPSPKPIHTRPNPKQTRHSLPSCRQAKRKAVAAISSAVDDGDYEGDIAENCEEDYELAIKDCSNSRIQGPKMKKARKGSRQETFDKKWDAMYQSLLEYKAQHSNTLVPIGYDKNPQLGSWVYKQRYRYSKKQLSSTRVLRLESIGFAWSCHKLVPWESMFQLLKEYKAQHGNTLVPRRYDKNPQLGKWVDIQRWRYSKTQLSSTRILRLESIGFVFAVNENNWMHMYRQLCFYKEKKGSTTEPGKYTKNPALGSWVYYQRHHCKKKERVKLLDDIDFVWEETTMPSPKPIHTRPNPKQTRHSLPSCRQAKRKAVAAISSAVDDGDYEGDIAENCEEDYELAIKDCSNSRIQGPKMKKARKGSRQETFDKKWDAMYQSLLEYKAQHSNTLVPRKYDKNPQLGSWVYKQRYRYSKKQLSSTRVLRLESIGFAWSCHKLVPWESMFQLLKE